MKRYWLVKTEPTSFSIEDLREAPRQTTAWEGVRNYQARNLMRDGMKKGDGVLFYHSSCEIPAVMGTARVASEPYPDATQFDRKSKYFDAASTKENPRWILVDIQLDRIFEAPVTLETLRTQKSLSKMMLLQRGSRLSVQPVTEAEWNTVLSHASQPVR